MRIDKYDILAILLFPLIIMALLGFYIIVGISVVSIWLMMGLIYLWDLIINIDYRFNGVQGIKTSESGLEDMKTKKIRREG
jgi:hypothetical protein